MRKFHAAFNNYFSSSFKCKSIGLVVSGFVFLTGMVPGRNFAQVVSINLNSLSVTSICPGGNLDVNLSSVAIGTNTYTVELSDNTGSFTTPTDIGIADITGNATNAIISVTIPSGTIPGSGYLIKVVSGAVNSNQLSITVNPDAIITLTSAVGTDDQTRCINTAITDIS